MKKIVILLVLLAGGGFIYKLATLSSQDDGEETKRSSRWANAHINPRGDVAHNDNDSGDDDDHGDSEKKKDADGAKAGSKLGKRPKNGAQKIENPFLKSRDEVEDITWEQAKEFAFREIDFKPQNEEEASLLEMGRMMAATFLVPNSHTKLIEYYESKGLKPDVARDSNPYTGTMITVRTEKNLPGTRYPHTQYFTNENNVAFQQHYSIEFRPGPNAFKRAQKMIEKLYGVKNGKPSPNGRFMNYKLGNGQIVWVQKMQEADLKGNPFNAYEATDVGTIRMAIEQEIHPEEDGHDHSGN